MQQINKIKKSSLRIKRQIILLTIALKWIKIVNILLNLFNDLLDTILIDKTLISSKDENEKQIKLLNNDNNSNAKKNSINTKKKGDENKTLC